MQVLFGVIADTTNSTVLLWNNDVYNQVIKKLHTLTQFLFHILHSVVIHFYISMGIAFEKWNTLFKTKRGEKGKNK